MTKLDLASAESGKSAGSNQTAVRNNGGGVLSHNLFFDGMTPASRKPPWKACGSDQPRFGSFENFKNLQKASGTFWIRWAWLVSDENSNLKIVSTANQTCPSESEPDS